MFVTACFSQTTFAAVVDPGDSGTGSMHYNRSEDHEVVYVQYQDFGVIVVYWFDASIFLGIDVAVADKAILKDEGSVYVHSQMNMGLPFEGQISLGAVKYYKNNTYNFSRYLTEWIPMIWGSNTIANGGKCTNVKFLDKTATYKAVFTASYIADGCVPYSQPITTTEGVVD
jgi:hypothetical protein